MSRDQCSRRHTMDSIIASAKEVVEFLPQKRLNTLDVNEKYHILGMKFVTTQFGRPVVLEMEERGMCPQTREKQFCVYLPKRWDHVFTEEQMKSVKPCALSLTVTGHTTLANGNISTHVDIGYVSEK